MRLVDVRHEQTAVFAAEATARLTRRPGLAVLTAGPGVTNGISAITTAHFNGSPVVVLAGGHPTTAGARAACRRSTTRRCSARSPSAPGRSIRPPAWAPPSTRRSGSPRPRTAARCSSTSRWRPCSARPRPPRLATPAAARPRGPDPDAVDAIGGLLASASRPVLVLGSDVWIGGAEDSCPGGRRGTPAAGDRQRPGPRHPAGRPRAARHAGAVGRVPGGRPGHRGRHAAGLPARLRRVRRQERRPAGPGRARRRRARPARHAPAARASAAGDLAAFFTALPEAFGRAATRPGAAGPGRPWEAPGCPGCRGAPRQAMAADAALLASDADPIHPCAIYGELARLPRRRRGRDRRRRRLRLLRRQVRRAARGPAAGSTPARTAAWAPASATRSRRGSPARRRRSCCCSATARPASR